MAKQKHICGQCQKEFDTEKGYLDHKCEATGFTPEEPEHLGEAFKRISEAALARGEERKRLEAEGLAPEEAKKKATEAVKEKLGIVA